VKSAGHSAQWTLLIVFFKFVFSHKMIMLTIVDTKMIITIICRQVGLNIINLRYKITSTYEHRKMRAKASSGVTAARAPQVLIIPLDFYAC